MSGMDLGLVLLLMAWDSVNMVSVTNPSPSSSCFNSGNLWCPNELNGMFHGVWLGYVRSHPDSNDAGEGLEVTRNRISQATAGSSAGDRKYRNPRVLSGNGTRVPFDSVYRSVTLDPSKKSKAREVLRG